MQTITLTRRCRHTRTLSAFGILLLILMTVACNAGPTRSFYMGLTPFPYAYNYEAISNNYADIAAKADLVAQHLDNGIPWEESLTGAPFPPTIMDDLQFRKDRSPSTHQRYVAVTPINSTRSGLAPAWTAAGDNQPLAAPWNAYAFNHPSVKTAYLAYCRRIVAHFNPRYLNIGVEANLLRHNNPDQWEAYLELHRYVYTALKSDHPSLIVMVSVTGIDLVEGYTGVDHDAQLAALASLMTHSDYYGLSLHPFCADFTSEVIVPPDFFNRIFALSDKPIAVCETSYPAESFTLFGGTITINGSAAKQNDYFTRLLDEAQEHHCAFVVNVIIRDYDILWGEMGYPDDVLKLWRDTGFRDGAGSPRTVFATWTNYLSRPYQ